MRFRYNEERCSAMGLNGRSQMRVPYVHKNLWWSIDNGETAFGYGDLDEADLLKMLHWVGHPCQTEELTITCWNEHHDTELQQMDEPMIRIRLEDGVTYPYRISRERRKAEMRLVK